MVRPIPEGAHNVIPHLTVRGAAKAIDFYRNAFGAREIRRSPGPGDTLMHAEVRIGDSILYLADEFPSMGGHSPRSLKGTPVTIHLWCEDVNSAFARAVSAGATVVMPLADQFWGDRYGLVRDPFGHSWAMATHVADLTPEQMQAGAAAMMAAMASPPRKKASKKRAAPKKKAKRSKKSRGK